MRSWIVSNSIDDCILYSICLFLARSQNPAELCSSFLPEFSILIADCGSCKRMGMYAYIEISLDRSKCVHKMKGSRDVNKKRYSTRRCSTFIVINNNEESLPFNPTLFAAFDYIGWMLIDFAFHFFWYRVKAYISIQNNAVMWSNLANLIKWHCERMTNYWRMIYTENPISSASLPFTFVCSIF